VIFFKFWEDDEEIRIGGLGAKGVDGVDVSYPGADGGEIGSPLWGKNADI